MGGAFFLDGLGYLMKMWIMLGRLSCRVWTHQSPECMITDSANNYPWNSLEEPVSDTIQITGSPETQCVHGFWSMISFSWVILRQNFTSLDVWVGITVLFGVLSPSEDIYNMNRVVLKWMCGMSWCMEESLSDFSLMRTPLKAISFQTFL